MKYAYATSLPGVIFQSTLLSLTDQNKSKYRVIHAKTFRGTDLDREELADEWHKHHVFTVPQLFGIDLYPASELPPLPTIPHKNLNTPTHESIKDCSEHILSTI